MYCIEDGKKSVFFSLHSWHHTERKNLKESLMILKKQGNMQTFLFQFLLRNSKIKQEDLENIQSNALQHRLSQQMTDMIVTNLQGVPTTFACKKFLLGQRCSNSMYGWLTTILMPSSLDQSKSQNLCLLCQKQTNTTL